MAEDYLKPSPEVEVDYKNEDPKARVMRIQRERMQSQFSAVPYLIGVYVL